MESTSVNSAARETQSADRGDLAFLSFWIGPVQSFIAAARTVRDLWTGSYLLAFLTRQAMQPLLDRETLGLDAFVSPEARGNPAVEDVARHQRSCLPNRFLAEVPESQAAELATACEDACRNAWREVCQAVRSQLAAKIMEKDSLVDFADSWTNLWEPQVESFFEIRTLVLPWSQCDEPLLGQLLAREQRHTGGSPADCLWSDRAELLAGVQAADKSVRHIPAYMSRPDAAGRYPQKCSLLGSYEQMGPADFNESVGFWEAFSTFTLRGSRTRKGERLCAVSLVKRFAWPAYFANEEQAHPRELQFDDTATVAAIEWLRKRPKMLDYSKKQRSSHWLHWSKPDQEKDENEEQVPDHLWRELLATRREERAPAYYAILMLDGDNMGKKLSFQAGAAHQRNVSRALTVFATKVVRPIVEKDFSGTLIYSGGDDVLALLPTARALACAHRLAEAFAENWARHKLPEPENATVSAGLAVVHYKEDLRFALNTARSAEKQAKDSGRNALMVTVCRRSGEHTSALCPWDYVTTVDRWVGAFLPQNGVAGASDRWAYHLAGELATLQGMPVEAMRAEIKRHVNRAESATRQRLGETKSQSAGAVLDSNFDDIQHKLTGRAFDDARMLKTFVTLCQTASFLARGRDQ